MNRFRYWRPLSMVMCDNANARAKVQAMADAQRARDRFRIKQTPHGDMIEDVYSHA